MMNKHIITIGIMAVGLIFFSSLTINNANAQFMSANDYINLIKPQLEEGIKIFYENQKQEALAIASNMSESIE